MQFGMPSRSYGLASDLAGEDTEKRIDKNTLEVEPEKRYIVQDLDKLFRGSTDFMVGLRV